MSALLGTRWVRAITFDEEVREDFEQWMAELAIHYDMQMRGEENAVKFRWAQGRRQALDDIHQFIELARERIIGEQESSDHHA